MRIRWSAIVLFGAGVALFLLGCGVGRQSEQKTMLHVFAYTPLESATQQDFDDFKKATEEMVGKVPGLTHVWVAKLREPIPAGDKIRTFAVGMEFENVDALGSYAGHPAHKEWERMYEKVRAPGTTTMDIIP
jgi:hypothetical protein